MPAPAFALSQHTTEARCHICVVSETYTPEVNGVALTLTRLVAGLRERGHVVSVVHPQQPGGAGGDRRSDPATTQVRGLPLPGYPGLQFGLPARRHLQRTWTQHRPDVMYVATEGPLGWSAVTTARRFGIPVLSGFHTNFHRYSEHYHLGLLQPVILHYLRSFHNRTSGTLVPSRDLHDRLQDLGFENVSILGRGVDTELFSPTRRSSAIRTRWGAAASDIVALYVGRVAAEKNLQLAVDAYRAMKQQDERVKFVIVGDGPLRATLQHDHPDIIFSGLLTGEQLAAQYASADVFLFPSETETFGNVTLEAMASGLAVIAYDYAAARMHIVHSDTGVLALYGDRQEFIASTTELLRTPRLLQRIRQHARRYAASVSWDQVIERFETLLLNAQVQYQAVTPAAVRLPRMMA